MIPTARVLRRPERPELFFAALLRAPPVDGRRRLQRSPLTLLFFFSETGLAPEIPYTNFRTWKETLFHLGGRSLEAKSRPAPPPPLTILDARRTSSYNPRPAARPVDNTPCSACEDAGPAGIDRGLYDDRPDVSTGASRNPFPLNPADPRWGDSNAVGAPAPDFRVPGGTPETPPPPLGFSTNAVPAKIVVPTPTRFLRLPAGGAPPPPPP